MTARRLAFAAVALAAVAYLAMLQVRAADREPPLVVLWTSRVVEHTVRHPRTGLAGWAVAADVDALVKRVEDARGWRETRRLRADAPGLSAEVAEVRGHRVALVEAPSGDLGKIQEKLVPLQPFEVAVVASVATPEAVLAAVDGPVAVLPGAYGAGVPDGGEAEGGPRLVAPWVDGRHRVGVLEIRFDGGLSLKGTAVDVPLREVAPDAPTVLGKGDPSLGHDTIHFDRSGLGDALMGRILAETGADVALVNYLALRDGLDGDVDLLGLERALPFHNEVVLQTFDSAQLARILAEGARDDTHHLMVRAREPLPTPLPDKQWRVATIDYLANGGRGGWGVFTEGKDRVRTRISLDDLAISLLKPASP